MSAAPLQAAARASDSCLYWQDSQQQGPSLGASSSGSLHGWQFGGLAGVIFGVYDYVVYQKKWGFQPLVSSCILSVLQNCDDLKEVEKKMT